MVTLPSLPALVRGTVHHERRTPFGHRIRFRTYQWLVDVDALPQRGIFTAFPVRDHFGGTTDSIRTAVATFLGERGIVLAPTDRVIMLSAGRSFGYAFDPLSVFWCIDADGALRCAILEIHNTYGDRHAHVVMPDANGRCTIAKEFYVSPFFTVDGDYVVQLRLDERHVAVSIGLEQQGARVFNASFAGVVTPATTAAVIAAIARTPIATWQTMARIRAHGIWLWAKRLPVIPRPIHHTQAGFR